VCYHLNINAASNVLKKIVQDAGQAQRPVHVGHFGPRFDLSLTAVSVGNETGPSSFHKEKPGIRGQ
jgi:hypothetical protein